MKYAWLGAMNKGTGDGGLPQLSAAFGYWEALNRVKRNGYPEGIPGG